MSFTFSLIAFLLVLGPLILIHELGHFWAAKLSGITVEEFGLGYPPRMLKLFERNGTEYTLNWIPLGGFMKPAGEDDPDVTGGFSSAPASARLLTLGTGPMSNIALAVILFTVMFMVGAPEELTGSIIVEVEENTPADTAGLMAGDLILFADDTEIAAYSDVIYYINEKLGEQIELTILRDEQMLTIYITPRMEWPENQGPTGIVVQSNYKIIEYGFLESLNKSMNEILNILKTMVEVPLLVIQGEIDSRFLRPVSVVGISQLGGQAIEASLETSLIWPVLELAAFISVALGITNLLPLPALDGGRIFFIIIELIRGKRIEPEQEAMVHFWGFVLLLASMIIFVYLDIVDPLI